MNNTPAEAAVKNMKRPNRSWIAYLVLALLLTVWSGLAALFFLVILWLVLRNPKEELSTTVGKTEKSTARRVYTWLFISPIITVPFFIIIVASTYSQSTGTNEHVLHALLPLTLHLPLLLGLTSHSRFVYRHTQQGILLIALRAGMASLALSVGNSPDDGIGLFLLGNGALWLFGSIWGWVQVNRSTCLWKYQEGEYLIQSADEIESLPPQKHIERSREFIHRYDSKNAKKHALAAFRRGNAEIKRQAVKILDTLDEVETF